MRSILMLEDGTCFEGMPIGPPGECTGPLMLHTAVVGYQEIMTDPANAGKILVFTYPLIGNYGVAGKFNESNRCWLAGVVVKEASSTYSNWQGEDTFANWLERQRVAGIGQVDTRALAVTIREKGEMWGIVSTADRSKDELRGGLQDHKSKTTKDFISQISVKEPTDLGRSASGPKIAVLDLGVLQGFLRQLEALGCNVVLLPYNTSAEAIVQLNPDGLIISNGPEEDEAIPGIVAVMKGVLGGIPTLGISIGHEIISLALGGQLRKMKAGHHGVNYPVKSVHSKRGDITVQNHSFVVEEPSLAPRDDVEITLRNVNDDSIEEIQSESLRFISAQYYPTSPGRGEVHDLFRRFLTLTERAKDTKHAKT